MPRKIFIPKMHNPILTFWHSQDMDDYAIAKKTGFAQETIRHYRQKLKLPHIAKKRTFVTSSGNEETRQLKPWPADMDFS